MCIIIFCEGRVVRLVVSVDLIIGYQLRNLRVRTDSTEGKHRVNSGLDGCKENCKLLDTEYKSCHSVGATFYELGGVMGSYALGDAASLSELSGRRYDDNGKNDGLFTFSRS